MSQKTPSQGPAGIYPGLTDPERLIVCGLPKIASGPEKSLARRYGRHDRVSLVLARALRVIEGDVQGFLSGVSLGELERAASTFLKDAHLARASSGDISTVRGASLEGVVRGIKTLTHRKSQRAIEARRRSHNRPTPK